jgi:hypothetical protein
MYLFISYTDFVHYYILLVDEHAKRLSQDHMILNLLQYICCSYLISVILCQRRDFKFEMVSGIKNIRKWLGGHFRFQRLGGALFSNSIFFFR